jgi:catechol 2,3-dioxygenase-like lactoylglutathione lyase family enzyme
VSDRPRIERTLETALYVDDMPRAVAFYRDVLGFGVLSAGPRLTAMDAGHATVLLLFQRGATVNGLDFPGGRIPPHDGAGPIHVAFAIEADAFDVWDGFLTGRGVAIESRVQWERGGRSLYFRDPDGHSVELVTPGVWTTY